MAAKETVWFSSKIDRWAGAVLVLAPVATLAGAATVFLIDERLGIIAAGAGLLLVLAIYAGLVFPMRYGIEEDELVVRYGLVRQRIRLAEIVEVTPTRDWLSSPALSLDRLRIKRGGELSDPILISPADREGFLALLGARAGLERRGDTLVRG